VNAYNSGYMPKENGDEMLKITAIGMWTILIGSWVSGLTAALALLFMGGMIVLDFVVTLNKEPSGK